jgi:hypothetical protein
MLKRREDKLPSSSQGRGPILTLLPSGALKRGTSEGFTTLRDLPAGFRCAVTANLVAILDADSSFSLAKCDSELLLVFFFFSLTCDFLFRPTCCFLFAFRLSPFVRSLVSLSRVSLSCIVSR